LTDDPRTGQLQFGGYAASQDLIRDFRVGFETLVVLHGDPAQHDMPAVLMRLTSV
jgi:hypothetical protein